MNPSFLELVDEFSVHQPWYEPCVQTFVLAFPETVEEVLELLDQDFYLATSRGILDSYFWKEGDQEHPSVLSYVMDKRKLSSEFLCDYQSN